MNIQDIETQKRKYGIVGNCPALNRALDVALQVAKTELSVLITGESGVGKEILPRMIHDNSLRKSKKYFAVNCGSIPEGTIDSELFGHEKGAFTGAVAAREGYFGSANGGTLFLDEVGELPVSTQARLLRVLETGEYIKVGSSEVRKTDVRIIAATNINMAQAIRDGWFREDLYYRLNTIPVKMPPLRERGNDIVLLFKKFALDTAEKYNIPQPVELTEEAQEKLKHYSWPGNIRQLKNMAEQISILSSDRTVTPEILSQYIPEDIVSHDIVPLNARSEAPSFGNEREILYQAIFEMRNELNELKKMMAVRFPNEVNAPARSVTIPYYPAQNENPIKVTAAQDFISPEELDVAPDYNAEERKRLIRALEQSRGKACRRLAAKNLNISERTLYRKIKQYGLDKEGY